MMLYITSLKPNDLEEFYPQFYNWSTDNQLIAIITVNKRWESPKAILCVLIPETKAFPSFPLENHLVDSGLRLNPDFQSPTGWNSGTGLANEVKISLQDFGVLSGLEITGISSLLVSHRSGRSEKSTVCFIPWAFQPSVFSAAGTPGIWETGRRWPSELCRTWKSTRGWSPATPPNPPQRWRESQNLESKHEQILTEVRVVVKPSDPSLQFKGTGQLDLQDRIGQFLQLSFKTGSPAATPSCFCKIPSCPDFLTAVTISCGGILFFPFFLGKRNQYHIFSRREVVGILSGVRRATLIKTRCLCWVNSNMGQATDHKMFLRVVCYLVVVWPIPASYGAYA